MRILLPLQTDVLTPKAHVYQTFKTCESFASQGHEATLLVPLGLAFWFGKERIRQALFEKYNVRHPFSLAGVPVFRAPAPFPFNKINGISFAIFSNLYALLARPDALLSRDLGFCRFFSSLRGLGIGKGIKFVYEVHNLHSLREEDAQKKSEFLSLEDKILSAADIVVVLMEPVAKLLMSRGVPKEKIIIVPCGVDLPLFEGLEREPSRKRLGISDAQKIVLYSGHLYEWKGVRELALAMKNIDGSRCWMVGGQPEDRQKMQGFLDQNKIKNVDLQGQVDPREVRHYIASADVAVVPTPSRDPAMQNYSNAKGEAPLLGFGTPMKLLEYMAAGANVVATDIAAHREVLNSKNATIVQPDSSKSLASGIRSALGLGKAERSKRGALLKKAAIPFDWMGRSVPIIEKIGRLQ